MIDEFVFNVVCQVFGPKLILRGAKWLLFRVHRLPLQTDLRPPGLVAVLF